MRLSPESFSQFQNMEAHLYKARLSGTMQPMWWQGLLLKSSNQDSILLYTCKTRTDTTPKIVFNSFFTHLGYSLRDPILDRSKKA